MIHKEIKNNNTTNMDYSWPEKGMIISVYCHAISNMHRVYILFSVRCILFCLASALIFSLNLLYNSPLVWFDAEILINHMFKDSTLHVCNLTRVRSCHITYMNHCWLSIMWCDIIDLTKMLCTMTLHATSVVTSAASEYSVVMRWTTLHMIVRKQS